MPHRHFNITCAANWEDRRSISNQSVRDLRPRCMHSLDLRTRLFQKIREAKRDAIPNVPRTAISIQNPPVGISQDAVVRQLHGASARALMRDSGRAPIDRSSGSILGTPLVQTSFRAWTPACALLRDSGCTPMIRSRGSILGRSPLVQTSFPELGFFKVS